MAFTPGAYCPRCRSRLMPLDDAYMRQFGVCSGCATWTAREPEPEPEKKED